MQRARRLASAAVVATLTVSGLAACRSQPDVAVYFGNTSAITVSEVQRIYNDVKSKLETAQDVALQRQAEASGAEPSAAPPVNVPVTGPQIVGALVTHDIVSRVAKAKNVTLTGELPLAEAGQALGLPPDSEYLKVYVENRLLLNQLLTTAKPVRASDADVQHVFDVFKDTGAMDPSLTFDKFKQQVSPQALQTLGSAVAVRNDVQAQLDQLNVKVNPRYEPAEIDVYSESGPDNQPLSLVSVPLADTDDASPVTDAA
jgi:hypothetical protein